MGLAPEEAAMLGGSAVLSTHKDGKPGRRLYINIFFQGLSASAPFFTAAAFMATLLRLRSAILNDSQAPWSLVPYVLLAAGAVAFAAPVLWGLRPETVEMSPALLRITTPGGTREIPWSSVRKLRATTIVSYVSRRIITSRPAIVVTADAGIYTMKYWRFSSEDMKQFFNYAASKVLPAGTPVIDDLHWLTPDKASHPGVSSQWVREYNLAVRIGLAMMVVGLFPLVGFWVDAPLVGAIGAAMMFMGMFAAVLGWSALSEEKKKREQM
jgi:hypothetical protein